MKKLALLVVVAACGGSAKPVVAPKIIGPDVDADTAEAGARGLVTEVYQTLDRGDTDGLMTLLSDRLVVLGPRRADTALATRADALVALGKVVDAKHKNAVRSSGLVVTPAPGGHSAWAFDTIGTPGGDMAVVAVLENADDIWLVDAAAVSELPKATAMKRELAEDAVVPPAARKAVKLDDPTRAVVDKFTKGLLAQDEWGVDLIAADGLVAGPRQGELAHGTKAVKAAWKKRMGAGTKEVALGEVSAQLTPDGKLAWVTAPVTRTSSDESVPLRVFAVFQKKGADWQMVALQESVAIETAGAGVAMHKAPPVEKGLRTSDLGPRPEVAKTDKPAKKTKARATKKKVEVVAEEDEDKPKAKPKKKKVKPKAKPKKKKPVDDDED